MFNFDTRAAEISQMEIGAELLVARSALQLNDLKTPDRVCRDRILAVQHTLFSCGGVALGIRLHHIVCDASGLFQRVGDLAELYRGLSGLSRPVLFADPEIQSYLREPSLLSEIQRKEALMYQISIFSLGEDPVEASSPHIKTEAPTVQSELTGKVTGCLLRFSGRKLQQLEKSAKRRKLGIFIRSIVSHLYRARVHSSKWRGASDSEVASRLSRGFWASIEARGPTRLGLSQEYFPNAATRVIHDVVRSFEPEETAKDLNWIAVQPDKSQIKVKFPFSCGNSTVSQWSKHQTYLGVNFNVDEDGNATSLVLFTPQLAKIT
ncbi:hypothetical protein N7457_000755 [Penicillium paradoxum]|uniref:uncharacterized protein n=1 Tax=Penicillium paradoxum TaxID=176176 RepID=UPI002549BDE2|nr:uncharacterized protein N7457_000755 [Penicillium paradoxum]KAJ5794156.1 hypothetical protein N7457_000755 [Penicillium paradoxum]